MPKKDKRLQIRVSDEEKKWIEQKAKDRHLVQYPALYSGYCVGTAPAS